MKIISLIVPGEATKAQIEKKLEGKRIRNREVVERHEDYFDDWEAVGKVTYLEGKIFNDIYAAEDYCSDKFIQGEGLAVKFKMVPGSDEIRWLVSGFVSN